MIFDDHRVATCVDTTENGLCYVPWYEYKEGMVMSIMIGLYYLFQTWIPLVVYYTYKKNAFESGATVTNGWYMGAWYTMVYGQFLIFLVPSFIWPFSYIRNPTILGFYAMLSQWLPGFIAFMLDLAIIVQFAIAAATLNDEFIWIEMAFFIVLQVSAFFFTLNKMPLAYNLFYLTKPIAYEAPTNSVVVVVDDEEFFSPDETTEDETIQTANTDTNGTN